jgi:hypothetical protein
MKKEENGKELENWLYRTNAQLGFALREGVSGETK